jgi:hypothetical protein
MVRKSLVSSVLLLPLLLAIACPVRAADPKADLERLRKSVYKEPDGFLTLKCSGYTIKTDIDEAFAAEAALYLREFYDAFRSFFKPEPKLKATPLVYFFKDQPTYQDFVKKRGYDSILKAGGAYVGSRTKSELLCYQPNPGAGFKNFPLETLRHEGAHQLLAYILGTHDMPIWYNEGVATFFESWSPYLSRDENLENLKNSHTRFWLIAKTSGTKDFRDLNYLLHLTGETWSPDNFGPKTLQHYAEAQSFMTFLLVSEKGRLFFAEIFKAVAAGRDPAQMLTRKTIDNAQKAWYKDIEERIGLLKERPAPETKKDTPAPSP